MKLATVLMALCLVGYGQNAEAQILKKIKKKAEKAAERAVLKKTEEKTENVVENAFDSIAKDPNEKSLEENRKTNNEAGNNQAKEINTEAKRSFYTSDIIVKTAENGARGSYSYFDADELAMKGESPDGTILYIDSEGYQYGFNEGESRWEKTGLMKSDAMAFMLPMASMSHLNLPPGPTLETTEKFKSQGMSLSTFPMVEWAFIYKPEHFRTESYKESTDTCGGEKCIRFSYNDSNYKDSYVLFDSNNRLSKIFVKIQSPEGLKEGEFNFEYRPVDVSLPAAVEVKMPFQDLWMKGLDADPSGGNNRIPSSNSASTETSANNDSDSGENPNEEILNVDANNPLSYPGLTAILKVKNKEVVIRFDAVRQLMEMDVKEPKVEPMIFDKYHNIYLETKGQECLKVKFNLDKAFAQIYQGLRDKTLPPSMDIEKIKADYFKRHYGMDIRMSAFPIADWPTIYKPEYFKNNSDFKEATVPCQVGPCSKFTRNDMSGENYILFDKYGRLSKISSTEGGKGTIDYTYQAHNNIKAPTGCQEHNMNSDFLDKMFKF